MLKPLNAEKQGAIYAFLHFSIEVICFYRLFSERSEWDSLWLCALTYDALAFVPQSFFGILTDKYPKIKAAPSGFILAALSFLPLGKYISLVLLALGNALIHIAGANATLRAAHGKTAPSGIFVGGGSFGVIAGQLLGSAGNKTLIVFPLVLCIVGFIVTLLLPRYTDMTAPASGFREANEKLPAGTVVLLMFLTVAARAYIGYAIPTAWNKKTWQTVLLFVCMGAGKMLGGVFADRFGSRKTAVVSLLAALPFLLFGDKLMAVSLFGVLLFSMTMPISLGVLVSVLADQPGLSFGITTVGLFTGTLPVFFIKPHSLTAHIVIVTVLTLAAAACFFISAADNTKERKNQCS